MKNLSPQKKLVVVSATAMAVGALLGGTAVVLVTRAIPKMMSRIMGSLMQNMMSQMKTAGCASDAPGG